MFLLKFEVKKNYNIFPKIFETLDEYKTLILEKISDEQYEQVSMDFDKILSKIIKL